MRLAPLLLAALLAAVPAAAALAQQANRSPGGVERFGNSEQPIQIDADSLEVQQNEQMAVFRGNVQATQGEVRLRADELRVHYRGDAARPQARSAGPASGNIVRIDALGHVFVSSPSETAQGDVGVYDVPRRVITLNGNVVLTRGANVLRGNQLVMDMDSGRSQFSGGRVRALIDPKSQ